MVLLLSAGVASRLFGQYMNPDRAMVSYRDGSFFVGQMLSRATPKYELLLSTGDTIHLNPGQITKMVLESEAFLFSKQKYHLKKSVFVNSSLSVMSGWLNSSVQWDATVGASVNERFDLGAGMGFSGHVADLNATDVDGDFFNIYGYGRFFLNKGFMRLYLDTKLGLGIGMDDPWEDSSVEGGFYFQPGIGMLMASKGRIRWNFGIGQYLLKSEGTISAWSPNGSPVDVSYDLWFNRTVMQVGISFMIFQRELGQIGLF